MDTQSVKNQVEIHELLEADQEGSISSVIRVNPTVLDVNDPDVIEAGNFYLPYSTGFEIECFQGTNYELHNFTSIPNIMHVDNSTSEQRFRIPSGIEGIICLYNICLQMKIQFVPSNSGIHYHIDCTDLYEEELYKAPLFQPYVDMMLKQLDTWEYKGTYNGRGFSGLNPGGAWIRFNAQFKTVEFRIGEMTFDYNLILKRILHLNGLMRYLKNEIIAEDLKKNHPTLKYEGEGSIEGILKSRTKQI